MTIAGFGTVGVIGAGQMGAGIAQVCAASGLQVTLVDLADAQLEKARTTIGKSLGKLVSKEKISQEEADNALQRLDYVTDNNRLSDLDLVIESAVENENVKKEILQNLDKVLQPEGIIATNTSSISITR